MICNWTNSGILQPFVFLDKAAVRSNLVIPRKLCVLRQRILYLVSCRWAIKFCNWENCVFLQGMKNPAMRQLSPEKVAGLLLVY